ncbi:lasso peptide biosynthesis PqqD family chaperone [Priestia aryabhattai]|uniref:lasso peptide biosynthesis PqqD family chaperone n=1 Tax=Priestia TaxID=2800373 RepID=UPI00196ACA03|nr:MULTISPECIES: lasso peptide biosynthesis PqqD family chaperone [Priestia]MED3820774.1 lasso peptide biosynthesis PqqD family chaperone [Priestia aryabhattai]QSF33232.1 lasso peptide biosynthesis PqqD family chaperone [Priestia megaterium]
MIKSEQILPKHVVTQSEGNIVSDMGNEKVMLNIENGKYYNLGEIGGDIWEGISKPTQVNELVNHIVKKYDVQTDKCEEEVISFLENMYLENLIELVVED